MKSALASSDASFVPVERRYEALLGELLVSSTKILVQPQNQATVRIATVYAKSLSPAGYGSLPGTRR
jgi:hypothetical protein